MTMQSANANDRVKKPEPVQTWENEGGALPDPVFSRKDERGFLGRLPDRILEARRRLGRIVLRNPELALGAAIGVGVLLGTSSKRAPLLKLLLGALATAKTKQFVESIAATPSDA